MFQIKDGYKLELQTPETMKLFLAQKKKTKQKNGEKVPSFEALEVILVQCNLVSTKVWSNIFTPNKSYTYLLNVESSNLAFLKTYITQSLMRLW